MPAPTRVLMLTNSVTPDLLGGLNRYVRELSAALVRKGVHVTVATKRVRPELPVREVGSDGVEIHRYEVTPKSSPHFLVSYVPRIATSVWRELNAHADSTDVVHAHYPVSAVPAGLRRVPYLYTFHAPVHREVLSERQGSYRLPGALERSVVRGVQEMERFVTGRAARIALLSEFVRNELAALHPDVARRASLIPGGLDVQRFAPKPTPRQDDWSAQATRLLFTARRLTPRMGILELIRAMPTVIDALPGTRLAIAGSGGLSHAIEREIADRGLGENVRLLGRISDDELVRWYRSSSLVVMPTQELEGFGLTTAEALACGTPVVGTPAGATPEILEPIDPRLVTRDTTSEALAEGIIGLLPDEDALRRAGEAGRRFVAETMGWDTVADRYLELYAELPARS
jgi:glycosyltransferase involved in cell wall biosynthesis